MHHFIYSKKDSWIAELSSSANFGKDEILELKKEYDKYALKGVSRILVQFDLAEVSQSVRNNNISNDTAKYYLKLYGTEGNKDSTAEYVLAAYPLSQSWEEGTGKKFNNPVTKDGVTWDNTNESFAYASWSKAVFDTNSTSGSRSTTGGGVWITGSNRQASQSFSYQSTDMEMDVTDIVTNWFSTTASNNGFVVKFSGSQETDTTTRGEFKFFSSNTNTIYWPKLEVRWDDHKPCTGSNTGSLTQLTMSGLVDNYLYMKHLRKQYRETEKVKFRVGARKRYIQKTFSTSPQTVSGSFIPEGSGSYSIVDIASGETVVPFSAYTSMSCDATSNYFIQWLNGFSPDRIYKILYKLKYEDKQEIIYDDDFEFKVVR